MKLFEYAGRQTKSVVIGAVLLIVSLSAAWSIGQGRFPVEPAPMERLLETAEDAVASTSSEWDLPVTRNESVDRWITFLNGRNAEKTRLWLERKGRYAPMIQAELRRRGMPEDLIYLALIESGFSPKAYSRAAASGLWQFIEETGERYGLEVSADVDERRDPIRSTTAALDYLQELYDRFGSWYLAAAAYNTGENRVDRILRERAGGARGDDALFWKIAPYLPRETRDYVPLMLAAGHIGKEPAQFGFEALDYHEPLSFETVWVPGSTELSMVARASGVDEGTVAELNPHLIRGRTPKNRGYAVRVPQGTRVAFETNFPPLYRAVKLARVEKDEPSAKAKVASVAGAHRVRAGETLGHIGRRYGVSVTALRSANGNLDPRRLRVGQTLRVPGVAKVAAAASGTKLHRVRSGENLTRIARRYGVTIGQLKNWNGLNGSRIYAGQRLRIRV